MELLVDAIGHLFAHFWLWKVACAIWMGTRLLYNFKVFKCNV